MKYILIILASVALVACGADVGTTAATATGMKKQELEQREKTTEQVRQNLNQSMEQMQQKLDAAIEK